MEKKIFVRTVPGRPIPSIIESRTVVLGLCTRFLSGRRLFPSRRRYRPAVSCFIGLSPARQAGQAEEQADNLRTTRDLQTARKGGEKRGHPLFFHCHVPHTDLQVFSRQMSTGKPTGTILPAGTNIPNRERRAL
jgi:hypothetical protein